VDHDARGEGRDGHSPWYTCYTAQRKSFIDNVACRHSARRRHDPNGRKRGKWGDNADVRCGRVRITQASYSLRGPCLSARRILITWLRVFGNAKASRMGQGGGHQRHTRAVRPEKW